MELIKRGIPTVLLIGEDFTVQADLIARSRGMCLKYAVFPRTINGMSPEEVEKQTDQAGESVVKQLLSADAKGER